MHENSSNQDNKNSQNTLADKKVQNIPKRLIQKRPRGRIRNLVYSSRIMEKISQEELAEAVGVTRRTISALENGDYMPSVYLALRLAQYFSTPCENLFKIVSEE